MTAVSQNMFLGLVTAPIPIVPEAVAGVATGIPASLRFLNVLEGSDADLITFAVPQSALPIEAGAANTVPSLVPTDTSEELQVVDVAALSPMSQIFIVAPLLVAPTPPPVASDVPEANAVGPIDKKTLLGPALVMSAPARLGEVGEKLELPLLDQSVQQIELVDLGLPQTRPTSKQRPDVIVASAPTVGNEPTKVVVSDAPVPVAERFEVSPKNSDAVQKNVPDQAVARPSIVADVRGEAQQPSATTTALQAQQSDHSAGHKAASTPAFADRGADIASARSGEDPQIAASIPTSTESAWRQKWNAGIPQGILPAVVNQGVTADLQGMAATGAIAAVQTKANDKSGEDTQLAPVSAEKEPLLPTGAIQTPPASAEPIPVKPATQPLSGEQDFSLSEMPMGADGSTLFATDPALRTSGKEAQSLAPAPSLSQTLMPAIVEMTRRGENGPIELALAPEELGRLTISLRQEGDFVRVSMVAERPETLDLLRRHAGDLLADLRQSGFSGASFSFGQSTQNPPPQFAEGTSDGTNLDRPQNTPPPVDFRKSPTSRSATGAGLDLRL